MKLYDTPSGYQTIYSEPLFDGACSECLGDGSYLHPLASRVTCLFCDGWGSKQRREDALQRKLAHKKERRKKDLEAIFWITLPFIVWLLQSWVFLKT